MKKIFFIVLILFLQMAAFAQTGDPCAQGDQDGQAGCPSGYLCILGLKIKIPFINPSDPNEILGPAGYDTVRKWVSVNAILPYKILFENDPDFATAPAQRVSVYLPIDPKINPGSLRIGDFGFGSFNFTVPENSSFYTNRLDVRDSLGLYVDVTAGLDVANRRAFWIFQSIDPATGLAATLPADAGFLLVNDTVYRRGEGYVTLTLQPVYTAQTRDTIGAQASIIFDQEDTIVTNRWVNTIDAVPPVSQVSLLPGVVNQSFPVQWSGTDDTLGAGLKHYDIYYSRNNGPFSLLRGPTDSTGMQFTGGEVGSTYSFYSIATDNTGNREPNKTAGEQTTTVSPPSSTICPGSNISFYFPPPAAGYTYQWQADTGSGFADITNSGIYAGVTSATLTLTAPPTSYYGHKYRCVATGPGGVVLTGNSSVLKFSVTWLGMAGAAWETAANWSCNITPDGFVDVVINAGTPSQPVVGSNAACRSLTLGSGVVFTVNAGFNLNITGR